MVAACASPREPTTGGATTGGGFQGGVLDGGPAADVASACPPASEDPCLTAADCDDGLACTVDLCEPCNLTCRHEVVADACFVSGACWQADEGPQPCIVCRPDESRTGLTLRTGGPCDDGVVCTNEDVCDATGTCKGAPVVDCCTAQADCDDGDPCTTSTCIVEAMTCTPPEPAGDCCSAGVCCDLASGKVRPAGAPCGDVAVTVEYDCAGSQVRQRIGYAGCLGSDAGACSSELAKLSWGN